MAVDGIDRHRRGKLEERDKSVSSERADVRRDERAVEPNFQVRLETGKVHYTMVCFSSFFRFFLSSSHLFRTSDYTFRLICGAPAGVTQAEGHTGVFSLLLHLPSVVFALIFYREKDSAVCSPRRTWSLILCTRDILVLHLLGKMLQKISVRSSELRFELTSQCQKISRLPTKPPGRPA